MPPLRYAVEAAAMLGIAWGIVKWVGRLVRDVGEGRSASVDPLRLRSPDGIDEGVAHAAAARLRDRGLVTDAQLAAMSPRERALLLATGASRLEPVRFTAPSPVPPPSRAVGLDVFCPSCATPLAREALFTAGRVRCAGCAREIAAYFRRGRLTVIVHETNEERARRSRVDSDVA